jgi:hypothetical protein
MAQNGVRGKEEKRQEDEEDEGGLGFLFGSRLAGRELAAHSRYLT